MAKNKEETSETSYYLPTIVRTKQDYYVTYWKRKLLSATERLHGALGTVNEIVNYL